MTKNYVCRRFSIYRTPNPHHNQHILTYFPFNQLDNRLHFFLRKTEAAVKGEIRVDMFIFDVDRSVKQVQLRTLVMEGDSWKRRYRTPLRSDPYNDVKKK